jgi:hypothetical protein
MELDLVAVRGRPPFDSSRQRGRSTDQFAP